MPTDIVLIAITGGPCGGKSTFLSQVQDWLQSYGILSVTLSETASEFITAGITPELLGLETFEEDMLRYQLEREEHYRRIARRNKAPSTVILCDRGALDPAAYVDAAAFKRILHKLGHSRGELSQRYKLVVHLVTAADGAEKYYTLANNAARTETPEDARELDRRTQLAWMGHPHHFIIDNSTGFDAKMRRSLRALARVISMPEPKEKERKFKILNFQPSLIPDEAVRILITQDYLPDEGDKERRIRRSLCDGEVSYAYTEKIPTGEPGERFEKERAISQSEYAELLAKRDPKLLTIVKLRHCFSYGGHRFELDIYLKGGPRCASLVILEVELQAIDELVELPRQFELEEVTGDTRYDNRTLAESK